MAAQELISKKTRQAFREHFVGSTLRQIEMAFDAEGVLCDLDFNPRVGGERRRLVEQYYRTVDFANWIAVKKILKVYEHELVELENSIAAGGAWADAAKATLTALLRWLERSGFTYQGGRLERASGTVHLDDVAGVAAMLDAPELHRQIERLRDAADNDPGLAVGTAKELLETTCRTILVARGVVALPDWDLQRLLKETREVLQLLPSQIPDEAKGVETIKRLLGNLGTVAQSLAELRNLYGTGHGKHASARGLEPRHARLAVGAATTLATFLFETHENRGT